MVHIFRPGSENQKAQEGDIIRDVNPSNWDFLHELPSAAGKFEDIFLECIADIVAKLNLEDDADELSEPPDISLGDDSWGTIFFEFKLGQLISLADIIGNPDEFFPRGFGIYYAFRGERSEIGCAILRSEDGRFWESEEIQLNIDLQRVRVKGGSALADEAFANLGFLSLDYAAIDQKLRTTAAALTDKAGKPVIVGKSMLAVGPIGRLSERARAVGLPQNAVALRHGRVAYQQLQELAASNGFPTEVIQVFAIDLTKVDVPLWPINEEPDLRQKSTKSATHQLQEN
jgi:hypothetical protein